MDKFPTWAFFAVLALLILLSAFFSASETALMRLNRYRLRHLSRFGHRGARIAERLLERPDRILGVILLGNNFLNIAASAIATVLALRFGGDRVVAIATGILTFVILIFAEVAPKTLAALRPEPIAFGASYALVLLSKLLYPIVWMLNTISNALLRLFGLRFHSNEEGGITLAELQTLVLESGNLLARRQKMLLGVLELEEATVEDVMVPRSRIEGIDIGGPPAQVLEQLRAARHDYLPLYRESVDDVVGILHVASLLPVLTDADFDVARLLALAHEPYFAPEGTSLARQLLNFQREETGCALVVDEYGDLLGLLTRRDILTLIAGELSSADKGSRGNIVEEEGGALLIPGHIGVRTLNRRLGWHLPTGGPRTLNGLVLEQLQTLPRDGAHLVIGGHRAEIVETNASGVTLLRFEKRPKRKEHHE